MTTATDTAAMAPGALGLRGAWGDIDDDEVDALVKCIYEQRREDVGRKVDLEG